MTEAAWIFLFDHISEYISGLTALIMAFVAYRQLERSKQREAERLEVSQKVEKVIENTDKIKTATDGSLTEVKEQLKTVTDQNVAFQGTIKALSDAIAARPAETRRETGEIIAVEKKNGATISDLLKEVEKLKEVMTGFGEKGMPVIASDDSPLPVKVEVVSKK